MKIVFIDYWQLLTNTDDWFLNMLLELYSKHKIVIIITSQLSRKIEKRRQHLPNYKDLRNIKNIFNAGRKCVVITVHMLTAKAKKNELVYLLYKSN